MQKRTVEAGGLSIAICEAGTGERHLLLVHGFTGAWEDFERRKFLACSPAMWAATAPEMLSQADRLDSLATLTMPVLVVVGEQDDSFLGHAQRMAKAIRTARLVVIPDAGHSPQFENTEAWWDALASFLEEVA